MVECKCIGSTSRSASKSRIPAEVINNRKRNFWKYREGSRRVLSRFDKSRHGIGQQLHVSASCSVKYKLDPDLHIRNIPKLYPTHASYERSPAAGRRACDRCQHLQQPSDRKEKEGTVSDAIKHCPLRTRLISHSEFSYRQRTSCWPWHSAACSTIYTGLKPRSRV